MEIRPFENNTRGLRGDLRGSFPCCDVLQQDLIFEISKFIEMDRPRNWLKLRADPCGFVACAEGTVESVRGRERLAQ